MLRGDAATAARNYQIMTTAAKQALQIEARKQGALDDAYARGVSDHAREISFNAQAYTLSVLQRAWERGWLAAQRGEGMPEVAA